MNVNGMNGSACFCEFFVHTLNDIFVSQGFLIHLTSHNSKYLVFLFNSCFLNGQNFKFVISLDGANVNLHVLSGQGLMLN